jgi:hypothetical protein
MLHAGRRQWRLFCLLLALAPVAIAQVPTLTTISDTVYRADGSAATGTLLIFWPAFTTSAGFLPWYRSMRIPLKKRLGLRCFNLELFSPIIRRKAVVKEFLNHLFQNAMRPARTTRSSSTAC